MTPKSDRLAKLAALTESPIDHEALAAARAVTKELHNRNTTLAALVEAAECHWAFEARLMKSRGLGQARGNRAAQERALREALCRAERIVASIPDMLDKLALGDYVDGKALVEVLT